jgi:uncharacterized protein YciI
METLRNSALTAIAIVLIAGCGEKKVIEETTEPENMGNVETTSVREIREKLNNEGYETFEYVDEGSGDTVLMQQYFMVFLKRGKVRSANDAERDSLQALHLEHLSRMYEEGYADISGPFGDAGEIRGITIYNTPTLAIADSLANLDPLVKSGLLEIEVHPWWAAKGFPLR